MNSLKVKEYLTEVQSKFLTLIRKEKFEYAFIFILGLSFGICLRYNFYVNLYFVLIFASTSGLLFFILKRGRLAAFSLFLLLGFCRMEYFMKNSISLSMDRPMLNDVEFQANVKDIMMKKKLCFVFLENQSGDLFRLKTYCSKIHFDIGDVLQVKANLFFPHIKFFELAKDQIYYAKYNNITAYGRLLAWKKIRNNKFKSAIDVIKNFRFKEISRIFKMFGDERGAGFVISILMGNSYVMSEEDVSNIRHIGIAHIIAISGLHMSIMLFIFYHGLRSFLAHFPKISLYYDVKKISATLSILFCYVYLSLSGYSISAVRSFLMISITLMAVVLNQRSQSIRSLYVAYILIALKDPLSIFHPSFQLSFVAVLSLISFQKYFNANSDILWIVRRYSKIHSWFLTIFITEVATTFGTLFFEMYHFGQFVLLGMFSNFVIIPFVEFVILPVSFLGLILPVLGDACYFIAIQFSNLLLKFTTFFSHIPFVCYKLDKFNELELLICLLGLIMLLVMKTKLRFTGFVYIAIGFLMYLYRPKPIFILFDKNVYVMKDNKVCKTNKELNNFLARSIENYVCGSLPLQFDGNIPIDSLSMRDGAVNIVNKGDELKIMTQNTLQSIPLVDLENKMLVIYANSTYKIFN